MHAVLATSAEHKYAANSLNDAPAMQLVMAKQLAVGTQVHVNYNDGARQESGSAKVLHAHTLMKSSSIPPAVVHKTSTMRFCTRYRMCSLTPAETRFEV